MPVPDLGLPYGMRDTRLTPYTTAAATVLGTGVDSPNARSITFTEGEDFEELRGDDTVVAIHGKGPNVTWESESGGIALTSYKTMAGGLITTTGVTPNQVSTYTKRTTDTRPYFKAEGQAINDNGGDFHVVLYRCKADGDIGGELTDGTFWLTGAAGRALGALLAGKTDIVYDFVLNETATAST